MKKFSKNNLIVVAIVIVIVIIGIYYLYPGKSVDSQYDEFAQCLAEKKITMYGAVWCPWCNKEKAGFGTSFKYVPYVECPDNPQLCLSKGIDGYPTWIFPDGSKLVGYQELKKLSELSGCPLTK